MPSTTGLSTEATCDFCLCAQMGRAQTLNSSALQGTDFRRMLKWEKTSGRSRIGNPSSDGHHLGRAQERRWAFCKEHFTRVSRTSLWQQARSIWGHSPSYHASFICEHMESLKCHWESMVELSWGQGHSIPTDNLCPLLQGFKGEHGMFFGV